MNLREYQLEAFQALHNHICDKESNPCIVIPTAGGKSIIIAHAISTWVEQSPDFRCCILAHRKELVAQNSEKFSLHCSKKFGIFSAGLKQRDYNENILFASIDSIYKKSGEFKPFDVIIVDEAHRIPASGEGKYRSFISGCKRFNNNLRIIGLTATPFRMGCGLICHKDHILNEVCYEAKISDLLRQGYLCNLRSKVGECQPELSGVKRITGGEYIINSLSKEVNKDRIVFQAIKETVRILVQEKRTKVIFFCVDIEHCNKVSNELRKYGINAPCVTSKTPSSLRDKISNEFKRGNISAICNVNVYTEGFDAPNIDCIVLLRPTLSPGLFYQMVGRGMRLSESKKFCLVLDFASCIDEHGPIDLLGEHQRTVMAVCGNCRESFSKAIKKCPICGWELTKIEIEKIERKEAERRLHGDKLSKKNILSNEIEVHKVDAVYVSRHVKQGSKDTIRVQYRDGLSIFREWIFLDQEGKIGDDSQKWWSIRFCNKEKVTVNEALENMLASQTILDYTKTITTQKQGKYQKIINYNQPLIT